jgi:tetratricopeptide (TPR) repeat protein
MVKLVGKVGVCLSMITWLVCVALQDPLAAQQEAGAQTEATQDIEQEEPEKEPPLIFGKVVDEHGNGIGAAWLTFAAVEDPSAKAPARLDDAGSFEITHLPAAVPDGPWTIGDLGAQGYLLVAVSVEHLDSDGNVIGDEEKLDYLPGVPMPEFRIPTEGAAQVRFVMGEKAEVAARWAEARKKAREAAQQESGQHAISGEASSHWASGNKKFNDQDYAGALADYDAALEDAPGEPRLLSAKASALYYLGQYEKARQAAEDALRAGAGDIQVLLALADRFNKAGDSVNAKEILRELEEMAPDNAEVQIQRARLSKREGDTAAAIAAYQNATRLAPQNPKLWTELATYCRENGNEPCAREAYATLVRLNPEYDKTAYYFLAALSEGQEAIEYYEKATRYVPEAYIKLCVAYREVDEMDKAIASCGKYLETKPDGPQADQVKTLLQSMQQ